MTGTLSVTIASAIYLMSSISGAFAGSDLVKSTLRIDNAHNAVWETSQDPGNEDITGTIKGGVNVAEGTSFIDANVKQDIDKSLKDINFHIYSGLSDEFLEVIGKLDAKFPDEIFENPVQVNHFAINASSVTNIESSNSNGNLKFSATGITEWRDANFAFSFDGSVKEFSGSTHFDVGLSEEDIAKMPLKSMEFEITEEGDVTTLFLKLGVPSGSPLAQNLRMAPVAVPILRVQWEQQYGIKVNKVEATPIKEADGVVSVSLLIEVEKLRDQIAPFIPMIKASIPQDAGFDVDELVVAINHLLDTRLAQVALNFDIVEGKLIGTFNTKLKNLNSLWQGYFSYMKAKSDTLNKLMDDASPEARPVLIFQQVYIEKLLEMMSLMRASAIKASGTGELHLKTDGENRLIDGMFNFDASEYQDYVAKAKDAGIPIAVNSASIFELSFVEGNRFLGDLYLDMDAEGLGYYKMLAEETLRRMQDKEQETALLAEFNVKDANLDFAFENGEAVLRGYVKSSPLTGIVDALMKASNLDIDPSIKGFTYDMLSDENGDGHSKANVYLAGVESKQAATEMMGLLAAGEKTEIIENVDEKLTMPALADLNIVVADALKPLQQRGRLLSGRSLAAKDDKFMWFFMASILFVLVWVILRAKKTRES